MPINVWFPADIQRIAGQAIDALVKGDDLDADAIRLEMAQNILVGFGLALPRGGDVPEWRFDRMREHARRDHGL